jgi:hypothetical protein
MQMDFLDEDEKILLKQIRSLRLKDRQGEAVEE